MVTFVLSGERIGPGLEYAAWLARSSAQAGAQAGGRRGLLGVQVVSDGDAILDLLGARATRRVARLLGGWGTTLTLGTSVAAIEADAVRMVDGRRLGSDLTAVVGPLRGPDISFSDSLTDAAGFVVVDGFLRSPRDASVFAAGDALSVPGARWRRTWQLSVRQAATVAGNVVASLGHAGPQLREFDAAAARRLARVSLPDVGGQALLVVNRKLLVAGRWPRRLRLRMDRAHFARHLPGEETRWQQLPE